MGGRAIFLAYFDEGGIFYTHFFAFFFRESYIMHIITVVGAQQKHKGMFFKHGGGGAKIFLQCHWGGGRFFRQSILPNHHHPSPGHK